VVVKDDLFWVLAEQPVSRRLWPEQTVGAYHRDVHPERRDITEDCDGLPRHHPPARFPREVSGGA
jgi:hypothetical protein